MHPKKHGIGSRLLSALLVLVMVFTMIPAMNAEAAFSSNRDVITGGHGMSLTSKDYITMPIKIMDYESDGMFFDYLFSRGHSSLTSPSQYEPEGNYWIDFTNTLSVGTAFGNIRIGSGMDQDNNVPHADGSHSWGGLSLNADVTTLGGHQIMKVERTMTSDIPLMWNMCSFGAAVPISKIRYMAIAYIDYRHYSSTEPKIGVSISLDDDLSRRYAKGGFSNWYYLDPNETGKWGVEVAVIDLHDGGNGIPLTQTVRDLYLNFPMGPGDDQTFSIAGLGCFENYGDAEQFGYWAASVGCMTNTNTANYINADGDMVRAPTDSYDNDNQGFSMLVQTRNNDFGATGSVGDYVAANYNTAGQQPLFIAGEKNLSSDSAYPYQRTTISWAGSSTANISKAIGYTLFQTIGDTQSNGYATVGLVESSLDSSGVPAYKQSTLDYIQHLLKNSLLNSLDREYDGWMYYSSIRGARNGEIFGYANGGQHDMDPDKPGVQGVPMDFASAIAAHWHINRNARDLHNKQDVRAYLYVDSEGNKVPVEDGSYAKTMAKKKYLEGSWQDCKQYITTWWDLAYYMMHNFWIPNSYNQLQSDYNYLNLYKSTNTSSDSYGHYVFDSKLTQVNASPYTSAVSYNKTNKTIGHSSATYHAYFTDAYGNPTYEAYNPFTPVHYGGGAAGESTNHYYFDDGVNVYSAYGGNLWYNNKNYGYSLVCNGEFTYKNADNLMFHFDGDDDVYLFINGELVMDLGATHNNTASTIYLNNYVTWAETVLKNRKNYTLEEVARAEKLALKDDETYSFDFYYMERHGTGANLRIETNINVVVPKLEVNKVASQNGVEVPDNGVVDNTKPVEYGFSLTNDGDTSKLYNISFIDSEIGVELTPDKGLDVKFTNLIKNKDGQPLQASDLVAYVDGYDGDPNRPRTKKLDTIKVTFSNNDELKQFLTNLTSDDGTQSASTDSLYSGDGLCAHATVTIRGFYYTQTANEQGNASFTNPVTAYAYNGAYRLDGSDTHTVYAFGEPAYFQWAGEDHRIIIDSEKLYEDLKNSKTYKDKDIPQPGHMALTLCDSVGNPMDYEHVSDAPGGDVYLDVHYPDPGLYTVYVRIDDDTGVNPTFTIALVIYVMDVKDSAVVLDYGLTADLTDGDGLFSGDVVNLTGKETLNTIMAITGVTAKPGYVEQNVSGQHTAINTQNGITMAVGTKPEQYSGKLDTPVHLRHDLPWVIEWKTNGSHSGGLMFSMYQEGYTADNVYIYTRNNSTTSTSVEQDFIAIGRYHNNYFDNHGVDLTEKGYSLNVGQYYRLMNQPYTDGTNRVVLFIGKESNGTVTYSEVGPLDTYWLNTTEQTTASTFISGKDFTFGYMGTMDGHPINLTNFDYFKVYEQGLELNNYRWEYNASTGKVASVTTGEPGNQLNTNAWKASTTTQDTDGYYGALNKWVQLSSDKQWAIEFKLSGIYEADDPRNVDNKTGEVMLLTSYHTTEHEYLYMKADNALLCFGTSDAIGYHNYGIALKEVIPNFSMADEHIYRIEHRIAGDGSSMAYLIVDGDEIGPMNNYFSGTADSDGTGDVFTDNNFMFCYLGYNKGHWPIDCTVHYLQVWEDTAMSGTYGWKMEAGKLVDASVADANGNRINFPGDSTYGLIDNSGEIPGQEGVFKFHKGQLTFTPGTFMQGGTNTVKVAVTVHDRGFVPTPLSEKTVDIANEVQMYKNISVIPATVVYYEDDFPSLQYVGTSGNQFTVLGGGSESSIQNSDQEINYGSDGAYQDGVDEISADSLHKVKINKLGALASFSFKGTGFELISRVNAVDSASIYLTIYTGNVTVSSTGTVSGGTQKAMVPVITQFDQQNDLGAEEDHQVPVVRWESGEAAANYTSNPNQSAEFTHNGVKQVSGTHTNGVYGTDAATGDGSYQLSHAIVLEHDRPWVMEFKMGGSAYAGGILLASDKAASNDYGTYIHVNQTEFLLGYHNNLGYCNSGIPWTTIATKLGSTKGADIRKDVLTFKLVNVVNSDGTNMPKLYVNGTLIGNMNSSITKNANISGKDFVFNYFGTSNHPLQDCKLEYVKVYENGVDGIPEDQVHNFRWAGIGEGMTSAKTDGYFTENVIELEMGTAANGAHEGNGYYSMNKPIHLYHDRAWSLEFKAKGNWGAGSGEDPMLLSSCDDSGRLGITYLWRNSGNFIAFGTRRDKESGYQNYGVDMSGLGLLASEYYTYRLENQITYDANGNYASDMVYLYIDDVQIGAMNRYRNNNTDTNPVTTDNWVSGKDFQFNFIGNKNFPLNGVTFEYFQVWENGGAVDTLRLEYLINTARDANGNFTNTQGCTTATWNAYVSALNNGQALLTDATINQKKVNDAVDAILATRNALKVSDTNVTIHSVESVTGGKAVVGMQAAIRVVTSPNVVQVCVDSQDLIISSSEVQDMLIDGKQTKVKVWMLAWKRSATTDSSVTYGVGAYTTYDADHVGHKEGNSSGVPEAYDSIKLIYSSKYVVSAELATAPTLVEYPTGWAFDPSGAVLTVGYSDGTTETVTVTENNCKWDDRILTVDDRYGYIFYDGATVEVPITVYEVRVTTQPTKTVYACNEQFDPTGMVVKVFYNNGTSKTITDYTYGQRAMAMDMTFVSIHHRDSSTVVPVTVYDIVVTTQPTKRVYTEGETFNPAGMVVTKVYNDGRDSEVVTNYTYSTDALKVGNQYVMVYVNTACHKVEITVNPKPKN